MADISFVQPMEGAGAEMDLLSGYPAEVSRTARTAKEEQRQQARNVRIWRLLNDLEGPGGEVAKQVLTLAVERMHELCMSDQKLLILFGALGDGVFGEIRQGDRFARESALEVCAMLLRLSAAAPRQELPGNNGEV